MNHGITKCPECGTIISQCRCAHPDKEVTYRVCDGCRKRIDEGFAREKKDIPVFCAWCKRHSAQWNPPMQSPVGAGYGEASHGICPECYEQATAKYRKAVKEGKINESVISFKEFLVENYK